MYKFYKVSFSILLLSVMTAGLAFAQSFTVSGKVTDQRVGGGMVGVNVLVKGTALGTITDINGDFSLSMSGPGTLSISFIGYRTVEVAVSSSNSSVTAALQEDITSLEEVVVSGLATTVKRSNLQNAVVSISANDLMGSTNPQTLDYALYGKMPGVNMSANSGAPGGGINMQFRGISTLGAGTSQPLYIIDGVYVDNSSIRNGRTQVNGASGGQNASSQDDVANRISDINPDDIERIEVLKGPSAAAIYGTRANAGVIIITTKRGTTGKPKVTFSQDIGMAQAQNLQGFEPWDAAKITAYYGTGARGVLEQSRYSQAVSEGRGAVDWEDEFYGETPLLSNSQISVSGGTENTKYYVSGGALNEGGIIKHTGFKRYSIRANVEQKIGDRFTLGLNTNYAQTDTDRGFTGNQNNTGGSLGYNIAYLPSYAPIFPDAQGNFPDNPYFNDNPIAVRDRGTNNAVVDRFMASINLGIDIIKSSNASLKFVLNGGIDYLSHNSLVHFPEDMQHQKAEANPGDVMWGKQDNFNNNIQSFLVFNTSAGETDLTTTVGLARIDQQSEFLLSRGRGLSGGQMNMRWAAVQSTQAHINTRGTDQGFYAQQEANWKDRVIASAGIRLDRSTLNADQETFYPFYKAGVAVNVAKFDFWSVSAVSQLKPRIAFGQSGGLPTFGNTFESLTSQLIGGQLGGQVSARAVDPNLVPETANELEIGLDMGFLDNKFGIEATYYNKTINDIILDLQPAESTGIGAIATNAGTLENKGFELALTAQPIRNANISWMTKLMYWQNRSKITKLDIPVFTTGGFGPSLGTYLISEGYSPTTIVGNPGTTDPTTSNRTVYGDRQANFDLSFYSQLTFMKNFEFNFLLHYKDGGNAINLSALLWDDGGTTPGWSEVVNGPQATNFGLNRLLEWAVDGNTGVYIQETSYLKLREISLYYTIPGASLSRMFGNAISRAKIGVSGNNILLNTPYGSYDPEVSNFGTQAITSSVEVTPYPTSRRMFFHLIIDF